MEKGQRLETTRRKENGASNNETAQERNYNNVPWETKPRNTRGFAFKPARRSCKRGAAERRRGYREYIREEGWQDGSAGRLAC